jgi:hypothetical protein
VSIGTSIVLFAVGAVLRFAVSVTTTGFNLHTIGLILMIVGAVGFFVSLLLWNTWNGGRGYQRQRRVVRDADGGYIEEERGSAGL